MNDDSPSEAIMAGPPPSRPSIPPAPATVFGVAEHTFWFLVVFYFLAVAWGIREIWSWIPTVIDLLISIALALCAASWAIVDGKRRKRPIPMNSQAWFFLFAGLLVPGYVIWTRGWRGAGWLLDNSVCWYLLVVIVMHTGGLIVFGEDWLRAMGL